MKSTHSITRRNAAEQAVSIAELWDRFCVSEHHVPVMMGFPASTWDYLKVYSSPKVFSIGKRNFVLVEDLKLWLVQIRDQGMPPLPKKPTRQPPS